MHLRGGVHITDFSKTLSEIGFVEGDIIEVLLSTISEGGEPNAAPMGVWVKKGPELYLRPYSNTRTAQNLKRTHTAVINLSQDPHIFLQLAFKEELPLSTPIQFVPSVRVKAPRIQSASGFIEVEAALQDPIPKGAQYTEYVCDIRLVELTSASTMGYSRARSAAIEAVLLATKIRAFQRDSTLVRSTNQQIDQLSDLVERIAPNSPSAEVIRSIKSLLPLWGE
ncbi:MAG: DUF447 domain-containing protein [Promethearchaeota archaeon]